MTHGISLIGALKCTFLNGALKCILFLYGALKCTQFLNGALKCIQNLQALKHESPE